MGIGVVLPAGGKGIRFGGPMPKQFLEVRPGRPLLRYALETFHSFEDIDAIVLVLPPDRISDWKMLLEIFPKLSIADGGADRWLSVRHGVEALPPEIDQVLIHDVARPFVPHSVIRRCAEALEGNVAVTAAVPATDTVKEIDGHKVARTLDRSRLVLTQTPQGFPRAMLTALYAHALPKEKKPTDEAQLAEAAGFPVTWVQGSSLSRKVTDPEDWEWAEWLAERLELGEITLHD